MRCSAYQAGCSGGIVSDLLFLLCSGLGGHERFNRGSSPPALHPQKSMPHLYVSSWYLMSEQVLHHLSLVPTWSSMMQACYAYDVCLLDHT